MRFLEEKKIENTEEEGTCGTCKETFPAGTTMVLEKYISRGKLIEGTYCDNEKCNPINDWIYKRNRIILLSACFTSFVLWLVVF